MNLFELLKKSRELINYYIGKFPMSEAELYEAEKLQDKIDEFLAAPSESAMEIVRKVRSKTTYPEYYTYDLTDSEAAALIESYGRRVPMAISDIAGKLEEAIDSEDWNEAKSALNDLWDLRDDGYKVEG